MHPSQSLSKAWHHTNRRNTLPDGITLNLPSKRLYIFQSPQRWISSRHPTFYCSLLEHVLSDWSLLGVWSCDFSALSMSQFVSTFMKASSRWFYAGSHPDLKLISSIPIVILCWCRWMDRVSFRAPDSSATIISSCRCNVLLSIYI